jgi:hypothetical protein
MNPAPPSPERVRFFECAAPDADERLRHIAERLLAHGATVERLLSSEQPELRLLIARGGDGELEPSPEVRQWRFEVAP